VRRIAGLRDLLSEEEADSLVLDEVAITLAEAVTGPPPEVDTGLADPDIESRMTALLPGDDASGHALHTDPNPYLAMPFSDLKGLVAQGGLSSEEKCRADRALELQRVFHAEGIQRTR